MASIRFTEVLNNNGTAVTAISYQERAISTDDFKWAYSGSGDTRYLEFYDQTTNVERTCTITPASYNALNSVSATIRSVTVTGALEDAPVGNNVAMLVNLDSIAVAFLASASETRVEYIFKGKSYSFLMSNTPTNLVASGNVASSRQTFSAGFKLDFIGYNRTSIPYPQASGTSGCVVSRRLIDYAQTLPTGTGQANTLYSAVTDVITEIRLNTPNKLILASTVALGTILPQ